MAQQPPESAPPGNRFAALSVDSILDNDSIHPSCPATAAGGTVFTPHPLPSRPASAAAHLLPSGSSHHGKNPEPISEGPYCPVSRMGPENTAPLQPWLSEEGYLFNGTTYGSLEDVVKASAEAFQIPEAYILWFTLVLEKFLACNIRVVYNTLAEKITDNKNKGQEALLTLDQTTQFALDHLTMEFKDRFWEDGDHIDRLMDEVNTLHTNNSIWVHDIATANRNNEQLNANMMACVDAIRETNRCNKQLEQQLLAMQQNIQQIQLKLHAVCTNPVAQAQFTAPPQVPPPAAPGVPLQAPNPVYATLAQATFAQAAQAAPAPFVAAPFAPAPAQHCAPHMPRILDPLKFSGEKKDHTLDQWLQSMGLWFVYYQIFDDGMKIGMAITYLEKGAANYMHIYTDAVVQGQPVGTWQAFVQHLETAYRNLAPEKGAQNKLAALCATKQPSMAAFAEKFWQYALRSGYADVELIHRISDQCSSGLVQVMVATEISNPANVPTTWPAYPKYCLTVKSRLWENKNATAHTHSSPAKDPDAMDLSAIPKKEEPMSAEQVKWLEKELCFKCGKHPYKKGKKCRNSVYKGFYKMPLRAKLAEKKTHIKAMATPTPAPAPSTDTSGQEQMEYMQTMLAQWDAQKGKNTSSSTVPAAMTLAHIHEIPEDQACFVNTLL
jgi:hypothetical protein